jgi:hypothetical protein
LFQNEMVTNGRRTDSSMTRLPTEFHRRQKLFPIRDKHSDIDIQRGPCFVNAMGMLQQDILCGGADGVSPQLACRLSS